MACLGTDYYRRYPRSRVRSKENPMNRKALVMNNWLMLLIATALTVVVIALLTPKLHAATRNEFTEAQCRSSLLLTRAADKAYVGPACHFKSESAVPLKCERALFSVDEKVTQHHLGKKDEDVTKQYDNEHLAESVVAEQMAACWKRFFEGQSAVFQQLDPATFDFISKNQRACFVCAEIQLTKGAPDFGTYIRTAPYDDTQNFYQYFTSRKAYCDKSLQPNCWEGIAKQRELVIKQDVLEQGKYAVVFMRQGMGGCSDKDKGDASKLTHTVQVIPVDDVATLCDNSVLV
jgi:hypothetical protein